MLHYRPWQPRRIPYIRVWHNLWTFPQRWIDGEIKHTCGKWILRTRKMSLYAVGKKRTKDSSWGGDMPPNRRTVKTANGHHLPKALGRMHDASRQVGLVKEVHDPWTVHSWQKSSLLGEVLYGSGRPFGDVFFLKRAPFLCNATLGGWISSSGATTNATLRLNTTRQLMAQWSVNEFTRAVIKAATMDTLYMIGS